LSITKEKSKGSTIEFNFEPATMPRRPRIKLADIPQHVVQRGINREPCFYAEEDYHCYLHWLQKSAADWHCDIHAYGLMTNRVHLLATSEMPEGIAKMMQSIGRRNVDWWANVGGFFGMTLTQLEQAAGYYLRVQNASSPGTTISFTGHSLGGGLASLLAVFFGETAVTFDQAPYPDG
jgi:hypothetical protein